MPGPFCVFDFSKSRRKWLACAQRKPTSSHSCPTLRFSLRHLVDDETPEQPSIFPLVVFELGFGVVGILLAWGFGLWTDHRVESIGYPFDSRSWPDAARHVIVGLLWSVPLLIAINLIRRLPLEAIKKLETWSDEHLLPMIRDRSLFELSLIAISAGLGEELFFRWALQTGFTTLIPGPWGIALGLGLGAVIFGLLHAITPTYGIIAGALGLVIGIELLVTESLVAAITTHVFYDFVVIVAAVREDQRTRQTNNSQD